MPSSASRSDVVAALRAAGCVFAEEEAEIILGAAPSAAEVVAMVGKRCAGWPLEQVVGWARFRGLRVLVDPGVFVPRRRTEAMAAEAVALAGRVAARRTPVVLDLCCGAGAVGLAVAAEVPGTELWAVDVQPAAVSCARRNVGARGRVLQGDLDAPLPPSLRGRVDVLVANVPYVPTGEIALLPAEARLHEPRVTLDGGADGLDVLTRVAALAPGWLAPGGSLLCETSDRQAAEAARRFARHGLRPRFVTDEDLGATVVVGTRQSAPRSRSGYPSRDTATS